MERVTGQSLDDDKPLSDLKRRSTQRGSGITVEKKPDYDWFDLFLKAGVNPQICERYAQAFHKDQMGEENLPDITPALLRTLGLKEGDILRVTKYLDTKFVRSSDRDGEEGGTGGLFSGPGGALRNNTRKGRPAPAVQTNDVIDPKAFEQKTDDTVKKPLDAPAAPSTSVSNPDKEVEGFEDNAWDVKPARSVPATAPAPAAVSPPPVQTAAPTAQPPVFDRIYERFIASRHASIETRRDSSTSTSGPSGISCTTISTAGSIYSFSCAAAAAAATADWCYPNFVRAGCCYQGLNATSEYRPATNATTPSPATKHRRTHCSTSTTSIICTPKSATKCFWPSATLASSTNWLQS